MKSIKRLGVITKIVIAIFVIFLTFIFVYSFGQLL